jgi:hypothetical protein
MFCGFKISGKRSVFDVDGGWELPVVALRGKGMFCIFKILGDKGIFWSSQWLGVAPRALA